MRVHFGPSKQKASGDIWINQGRGDVGEVGHGPGLEEGKKQKPTGEDNPKPQ